MLNDSLGGFEFYTDEEGKAYYKPMGADSGIPFSSGLSIKEIYITDATRPQICMEIDCTNINTLSFTVKDGVNAGGNYSRGLNVYTDRAYTRCIYGEKVITGCQEIDLSSYDSVVVVIADYSGGEYLISDFKLH